MSRHTYRHERIISPELAEDTQYVEQMFTYLEQQMIRYAFEHGNLVEAGEPKFDVRIEANETENGEMIRLAICSITCTLAPRTEVSK